MKARVYFHAYTRDEVCAGTGAEDSSIGGWREAKCMQFVHDSHSACEIVSVTEMSESAVQHALEAKHKHKHVVIDKINWLD